MNKQLILIVDDDPDIVSAMGTALCGEGYQVRATQQIGAALEILCRATPAIVFLDFYLAGENPAEFVRQAKALYPDVPVILMTAAGEADEKAKSIGLAFYLQKPFEIEGLLEVVRRCLQRLSRFPALHPAS